jgi:predicted aspartyl protease
VKVIRFDPADSLIIVKARVFGKYGDRPLSLALDTAASLTHLTPDITDALGYSARQGEAVTSVSSALGKETGYLMRVKRFVALGFAFNDFLIHVHDLGSDLDIDGLLGLNFLKHFNCEIRFGEGRILVDRIPDAA